jgi:hypothetical protein
MLFERSRRKSIAVARTYKKKEKEEKTPNKNRKTNPVNDSKSLLGGKSRVFSGYLLYTRVFSVH